MLLRFGVANFRSLRDRQELSLVASSLDDDASGLIPCPLVPGHRLLPAVVMYGANASGKSNLVKAIRWMRSGVVHYPVAEEVCAPFRARGFACEVRPLWGGTPFNSHLFVFRAPVDPSPSVREDEDRDERVDDEAERAGAAEAGEADVVRPADGAEARGG